MNVRATSQPSAFSSENNSIVHSRSYHLEIQLLGPFPQYFHDDFSCAILYPVYSVSSKLPLKRFLLLCLLSVLPHRVFQPTRTNHFHRKHPLCIVFYESCIHPMLISRKCVLRRQEPPKTITRLLTCASV